jgi:predicted Zn finger-like uncharacterized protein
MADQKFTRCPGCATVFRVTSRQLALREGQVRCGHCRAVFDANDHFVSLDAGPAEDEFDAQDELAMGRPTVTLRSADALLPVPSLSADERGIGPHDDAFNDVHTSLVEARPEGPRTDEGSADESLADERATAETPADEGTTDEGTTRLSDVAEAPRDETADAASDASSLAAEADVHDAASGEHAETDGVTGETLPANSVEPAATIAPIDLRDADRAARFEWKKRKHTGGPRKAVYAGAIVVLAIGIVLQGILEFRDALAAHVPATRALLASACRALPCTIEPLRDTAALSIDASDLQADPAHRGLLVLSATIRNRAGHAIAYPYLELTLTDSSDRVVVRRAFAPPDYAGGTADVRQGIAANGERLVKLFIDASATQQAGYRLYLFYP